MRIALLSCAALVLLATTTAAEARTYAVRIDKLTFGPVPSGLHVGDRIVWQNRDIFRHTATAKDTSFDVDIEPGKQAVTVLKKSGTIRFDCKYHPGMRGVLKVGR